MGTFGINIQTKVVLDDTVKSGSMTPKINIDPKDPQKIIHCINDSKEQIAKYIKPQGVETFTDPETGLIGFFEPGTKTKVLIQSIDLPLLGNCYKDGDWHGPAGKIIQSYLLAQNPSSAVAAKSKFDTKKAMSAFTKSLSSKFNAATGTFTTKNIGDNINNWWGTNKDKLLGGFTNQLDEVVATIESRCENINTIWSGKNKNTSENGTQVDEKGNVTKPLDKASKETDSLKSTDNKTETNTEAAKKELEDRAEKIKNSKDDKKQNNKQNI